MNKWELLNEFCQLFLTVHLLCFTEFVPDVSIRGWIGFNLIALVCINILANLCNMFLENLKDMYRDNLIRYRKWKHKKGIVKKHP